MLIGIEFMALCGLACFTSCDVLSYNVGAYLFCLNLLTVCLWVFCVHGCLCTMCVPGIYFLWPSDLKLESHSCELWCGSSRPLKITKSFELLSHLCSELHFFWDSHMSLRLSTNSGSSSLYLSKVIGETYYLAAYCLKFCLFYTNPVWLPQLESWVFWVFFLSSTAFQKTVWEFLMEILALCSLGVSDSSKPWHSCPGPQLMCSNHEYWLLVVSRTQEQKRYKCQNPVTMHGTVWGCQSCSLL